MIRTLVLFTGAIFANATTNGTSNTSAQVAACSGALSTMVTSCASSGLAATPTAPSIEGLCNIGMNPLSPVGCGYDMGKVALKCPKANEVPTGVTISSGDQAIIDGAMTVAKCCMKSSTVYKAAAIAIDTSAQESTLACWTGSGATTAWTTDQAKAAEIAASIAPLGAAVAAGTLSATGPVATSTSTSGGGATGTSGGGATGNTTNSSNSTNTTAGPTKASTSDAGKTTLAMAVFAGVAMIRF